MKSREHTPKESAAAAGPAAVLSDPLRTGGSGAPSHRRARADARSALCGALLALSLLAILPAAAQAHLSRRLTGSFGGPASTVPDPYPLGAGTLWIAPAVDASTGDVYVPDPEHNRVEKFDSSGHFLLMIGANVDKTAAETPGREAEAGICPSQPGDECQAGLKTAAPGGFERLRYVAVDNSSGPSRGDLYVGTDNASPLISKFDPSGHLIASWGNDGEGPGKNGPPDGRLNGRNATGPLLGPFVSGSEGLAGIAVDPSGDLWVADGGNRVFEFGPAGSFLTAWRAEEARGFPYGLARGIAIDAAGNIYLHESGFVRKFTSAGALIGVITPAAADFNSAVYTFGPLFSPSLALATDGAELYVGGTEIPNKAIIRRFDSSCHPVIAELDPQPGCAPAESIGLPKPPLGIGTDPDNHDLYVGLSAQGGQPEIFAYQVVEVPDVSTFRADGFSVGAATLHGTVNPSGVELHQGTEGCRFEWGEVGHPYEHTEVPCDKSAAEIGKADSTVPVSAEITGLQPGHAYHFRLVASNANDVNGLIDEPEFGADLSFGPPLIESASAASVTATTATLEALVNPEGADTHARIEYETEAQFEKLGAFSEPFTAPEVDLGTTGTPQHASFQLTGLAPHTAYRFRLIAENILGEAQAERAFTTQGKAPFALPDGRHWEQVSPPDKRGAALSPHSVQASATGDAIVYASSGATEASPEAAATDIKVLSARGPAGWSSHDLGVPRLLASGLDEQAFFSEDLSRSVVNPGHPAFVPGVSFNPFLSPEASEQTSYLHTDFSSGEPTDFCNSSCYRPLLTGKEGFANIPPGTVLAPCEDETELGKGCNYPQFVGSSPDGRHLIINSVGFEAHSHVGLTTTPGDEGGLYEWSEGALTLVSVLPGAAGPAPFATEPTLGSYRSLGQEGSNNPSTAVSADGSRVVWSEGRQEAHGEGASRHLYLRDLAREETVQLDAVQEGSGEGAAVPIFQFASADGSVVYFSDGQALTPDPPVGAAGGPDLYRCRIEVDAEGHLACDLTDLTGGGFIGSILGASADGSSIYFVANGVLASNTVEYGSGPEAAQPGDCDPAGQAAEQGKNCNLYRYQDDTTSFIAGLSGEDEPDWNLDPKRRVARVSPDGGWLAFMSQRRLTGYDSTDATSGLPDQEVFLYHAGEGGGEGSLICASCDPTGARPRGIRFNDFGVKELPRIEGPLQNFGTRQKIAAVLRGFSGMNFFEGFHQPRFLSDSGRLFFNSADDLLPQDSNGLADVYQFEPPAGPGEPASDDCASSSPGFVPSSGGCLALISSGTSARESVFLDASESGDDAFFLTTSKLTSTDSDTAYDVYDAHACSASVPCLPPPPPPPPICEGDACQQPAAPPNDPTPSSLTFSGTGNLTECPKGKAVKSGKCVSKKHKKAHKKQHKAKHKRAAKTSRRASR